MSRKKVLVRAGESVERRGFLDGDQAAPFCDPVLMAQVARLLEEVGEFTRSLRKPAEDSLMELADVVIVASAIAHLKEWNLEAAIKAKCARDEAERGYRHGEPAEDGHVYRDFG